jgi:purine-binding chemotaxis protein CheW
MARDSEDLWDVLARSGESVATEEDYEHGYSREVRQDLRRCLAFRTSGELYGLPIGELAEIAKPLVTTPVPRTTDFVIGIGNVRGNVIPVIDLARRLRLPVRPVGPSSRVLIVRSGGEAHGLLVDEVHDVLSIAPEAFEPPPGALAGTRAGFIAALARLGSEILIVLDLTSLLNPADFVRMPAAPTRGRA